MERSTARPRAAVLGLIGLVACAPTISEVHAAAVHAHLAGLARASRQVAEDAGERPRCAQGDDPVAVRAAALDERIQALAQDAEDHADGDWPSPEAFQEALNETSSLQSQLAVLRAEYDSCRAVSARPTDTAGVPVASGATRVAVLDVVDPGSVVGARDRAALERHLRARLALAFPLVPTEPVSEAQLERSEARRCPAACALGVAREVGAHKAVVVRIERADARCAVVLEVHDLATGVTERARTVRQECSPDSLLVAIEDAVAPLVDE